MRQVVLDTETTGLSPEQGHRIIEIGCVELVNRRLTDNNLHLYLNPDRDIDAGAMQVHGISNEFLTDKPRFHEVVDTLMDYLNDAEIIIHNAPFDVGFLNHELKQLSHAKWQPLSHYCTIFDTLAFARKKHPGQRNSLDVLCKRYDINNTHRVLHGALLDAQILSHVYLRMTSEQKTLCLEDIKSEDDASMPIANQTPAPNNDQSKLKIVKATPQEQKDHKDYLRFLEKKTEKNILWND